MKFCEGVTVDNKQEQQREGGEKPRKVGRMKAGVGTRYGAARTSSSMGQRQGGKAHNERLEKVERQRARRQKMLKGSTRSRQRCRQGKWKRNIEIEERNGAGLLRSSVGSQTATLLTLEKVQHIEKSRETPPAQVECIWYLPGAFVKEYNIVVGTINKFHRKHTISPQSVIPVSHCCSPLLFAIPVRHSSLTAQFTTKSARVDFECLQGCFCGRSISQQYVPSIIT